MTPDTPAMDEKGVGCPFCGADETEVEFTNSTTWCYQRCKSCGATGPRVCAGHGGDSKDAWNLRASLKAVPEVEVVQLRPLDWRFFNVSHDHGTGVWDANHPFGTFSISDCGDKFGPETRYYVGEISRQYATLEDAQAAVFEHYSRQMRPAFATPQTAPDTDGDAA